MHPPDYSKPPNFGPSTMREEAEIEAELQAKNKNAPRLSPEQIDYEIAKEQYYQFPETVMTVCCLTLRNGYNVVGTSAPASPENFDPDIARKISRQKARDKIWELEGYVLKSKLARRT
jgi:hypothetical protein